MEVERVSTGSEPIDSLLKGGVEKGIITNIFGASGTGKTNLCVQVAAEVAENGGNVVYIDTERGFSPERFAQIASEDDLEKIKLFEPLEFDEQEEAIDKAADLIDEEGAELMIVDSLVSLYRLLVNGDNASEINNRLSGQLKELSKIARNHEIPILVTNQVYTDFDGDGLELVGRDVPRYWSKCLLQLSDVENGVRKVEIEKHRSLPEGRARQFQISDEGLGETDEKGLF